MVIELSEADFEGEVLASELPVLVDFWSEHCGPCKAIAPVLDQLAGEISGIAKIGKVDVSSSMAVAARYGVRSVPTLLFFMNGEVKDQVIGSGITKEQLRAKRVALL